MSNYITFLRKEFMENMRTKRILVIACVFILFAVTSALLARYIAELFGFIAAGDETVAAIADVLPPPTWADSYSQFYENLSLMGMFVLLFMYMGTVQREIKSGTASLMFSKGLGFASFILAKFTMATIITTVITVSSAVISYVYTLILFDEAGSFGDVLAGSLTFSAGAMMVLAIIILCSSLTKSTPASAGMGIGAYFGLLLLAAVPTIGVYVPTNLLGFALLISIGVYPDYLIANLLISVVITIVALFLAMQAIKRAEG